MININKVTSGLIPPKDLKVPSPKLTAPALTAPSSFVDSQKTIAASSSTEKQTQAKALLESLWRSKNQVHQIGYLNRITKQFKNLPVKDISHAVSEAMAHSNAGLEAYFAISEYITGNNRFAVNVSGAYAFWMDVDVSDTKVSTGKGYATEEEAQSAIIKFCKDAELPEPTHIVSSGGGLHVYWVTDKFIERDTWQKFAKMLKALTKSLKCLADDTRTADIASVLRVPGTYNYKYNPPRLVVLTHASDKFISLDTMLAAIESAHERFCEAEVTTVKPSNIEHMYVGTAKADMHETLHNVKNIKSALAAIDPDCEREVWFKTCCALRSLNWNCGESLARAWSKGDYWNATNQTASKYDAQAFDIMWKSIKSDAGISIGTLFHYAKNAGWGPAGHSQVDGFTICETVIIEPNSQAAKLAEVASGTQPKTEKPIEEIAPKKNANNLQSEDHSLVKYSLRGMSAELEKYASEEVLILGQIALKGQSTVIYAAPNTGKTLLTIYLLIEAIKQKRITDPSKVFYVNVDDTSNGLLDKLAYAEEFGFHMFAEGYNGFKAKSFFSELEQLTENNQVSGVILILDTVKKFVNLMDKTKSSSFTDITRKFTGKGGTIIALAHTNKNLSASGKPVPAGTSDLRDDFDCSYTLAQVGNINLAGDKIVCFENDKLRGNVAQSATYSYSNESAISYTERLISVEALNQTQLNGIKRAEEMNSASETIDIVLTCIAKGINTKMELVDAFAKLSEMSKKAAIKFIDKYTGTDTGIHKWNFTVGAHGTKTYAALKADESAGNSGLSVAD